MHYALDVITPATCFDLTVLETAKTELGIAISDTSQDDYVTTLIKQASGIVAAYCDQVFAAEEVQETFWADYPSEWVRSFMLSRSPVTSIESVVIDGVTLDPSEYRLGRDRHVHRVSPVYGIGICNWVWTQTAVITYTAGYALLDDLPYGIERATLSLIKEYHAMTARDPSIRSEDVPGVRSVTIATNGRTTSGESGYLSPDVVALLAPYRELVFA